MISEFFQSNLVKIGLGYWALCVFFHLVESGFSSKTLRRPLKKLKSFRFLSKTCFNFSIRHPRHLSNKVEFPDFTRVQFLIKLHYTLKFQIVEGRGAGLITTPSINNDTLPQLMIFSLKVNLSILLQTAPHPPPFTLGKNNKQFIFTELNFLKMKQN